MSCRFSCAFAALVLPLATLLPSAPSRPPAATDLAAFAWLAGTWRSTPAEGELLEESFTAPAGNCVTGTFRWLRGGRAFVYEFMLIERDADGEIAFLLRHFGPGSVAWEETKTPIRVPLVAVEDGRAEFADPDGERVRRILYTREDDVLRVSVVTVEDGEEKTLRFRFERHARERR